MASQQSKVLKTSEIETPLGPMQIISSEDMLYLVRFMDHGGLERNVERLGLKAKATILPGRTQVIDSVEREINQYFNGTLKEFKTPLFFLGSVFQKTVWQELIKIPYGKTKSYKDIAVSIGNPLAFRAGAQANRVNPFTLIVPCHRVINANGNLGGYAGSLDRKKWLLEHDIEG